MSASPEETGRNCKGDGKGTEQGGGKAGPGLGRCREPAWEQGADGHLVTRCTEGQENEVGGRPTELRFLF